MSVSDLVGEIEGVRRRTRRASFGGAVPLALLGLLVAGAAPFFAAAYRSSHFEDGTGMSGEWRYPVPPPSLLDRLLRVHPTHVIDARGLGLYWLIGVPVTFALIAAYYVWRARRTGISLDGWRVSLAGGAVFVSLVLTMAFGGLALRRTTGFDGGPYVGQFLNPFLVVAVAAFGIAWVERSRGVLAAALVFLLAVVGADLYVYTFRIATGPWERVFGWGWFTILLGGLLLVAAGAVALARRRP